MFLVLVCRCLLFAVCRSDAVKKPADIISDSVSSVVVTLDAPSVLHCYAYGYPRPAVLWWKEDTMLPRNSIQYEQRRDNSLVIRHVTLKALGPYTCQAYNGLGRAASWTTTLHAVGSATLSDQQDLKFLVYLVPPPNAPIQPDPSNKPPPSVNAEITSISPLYFTPNIVTPPGTVRVSFIIWALRNLGTYLKRR